MIRSAVSVLQEEFNRLAAEGRSVDFWWRDDDAVAATPALDRLLAVAGGRQLPISLAVIPDRIEPSLPERLRQEESVSVLTHGWRHADHAGPNAKKSEFGVDRSTGEAARDLGSAKAAIEMAFATRSLPVFVPPWNRIAPAIAAQLPELGYRGLSCFGAARSGSEFIRIDTHLDPVDWHGSRSLADPAAIAAMMRRAIGRGTDTIGFLTHHLMFDDPLWTFTEELATLVTAHPAVRPMSLAKCLPMKASKEEAEAA